MVFFVCLATISRLSATNDTESSIGFEMGGYKYLETVEGDRFMSLAGKRYGLFYEYLLRRNIEKTSFFLAFQVNFSFGDLFYDGGFVSEEEKARIEYEKECDNDWYGEYRLLCGLELPFNDYTSAVMPYLGCGFRELYNDMGDGTTSRNEKLYKVPSYYRLSRYLYIPLGIILRWGFDNGWLFSLNPEYDLFLVGKQISGIDDGRGRPIENFQYGGFGFRVSFKISKKIRGKVAVFLEPFVKYWNIENSDKKIAHKNNDKVERMFFFEPKNSSKECGVKVGITF